MQIYAPRDYPAPDIFKPILDDGYNDLFITIRFHTVAEDYDFVLNADPDVPGYLSGVPHGNLLTDIWSDQDGEDWVASTVFKVTTKTLELAISRAFGDWRNKGLIDLMATRAETIIGDGQVLAGMENSTDWVW